MTKSKADLKIVRLPRRKDSGEAGTQKVYFQWLALAHPYVRSMTFAIPNGGSRHPVEAASLKAQGVTPGVPDIFCSIPSELYGGLYIEFKHGQNKLTKLQEGWIIRLRQAGYCAEVCYSFEEAKDLLLKYLDDCVI